MEIQSKRATVKGPAETFTGDVWFDVVVRDRDYPRMRVNVVRFAPGARTAWHAHPGGQTLYVTEGRGLVQSRGGEIIEIRPGDVIFTPPGEWHWHGAAPDHFMTHLAIWEVDDQGISARDGIERRFGVRKPGHGAEHAFRLVHRHGIVCDDRSATSDETGDYAL